MTKTILVTNDDGIQSPGIEALARELKKLGKVYVIAPDRERSAVGHSLTLHHPLRAALIAPDKYSVDGTPTDCVMLGILGFLKTKPDLVVSGINLGPNMGDDITYSGTVSAAIEGTLLGIPSFAISLVDRKFPDFRPSASFAQSLAKKILQDGLPKDTLLNVNIPALPKNKIKGIRIVRQGKRIYRDKIIEKTDPRGRHYYWIGGEEPIFKEENDTDFHAVSCQYVSITPLHLDLTASHFIPQLKKWRLKI